VIVLGVFESEEAMERAVVQLRADGVHGIETYSPASPSEAPNHAPSRLPLVMLVAGLVGAAAGMLLQIYAVTGTFTNSLWGQLGGGFPVDIGGRPNVFWVAFIPFGFETGLLFAMVTGFFGFILINRLPRLYDQIDESDAFRDSTRSGWFIAVRTAAKPNRDRALAALRACGAPRIEEILE
jgi:hypothetical protein